MVTLFLRWAVQAFPRQSQANGLFIKNHNNNTETIHFNPYHDNGIKTVTLITERKQATRDNQYHKGQIKLSPDALRTAVTRARLQSISLRAQIEDSRTKT